MDLGAVLFEGSVDVGVLVNLEAEGLRVLTG